MGRQSGTKGVALTPAQLLLCDYIRDSLTEERAVREVPMFGGLSFMVDERMTVAAQKNGDLLVRIDPAQSKELLCLPDTTQAEMRKGRSMGLSWVVAKGTLTATQVSFWIGVAMAYRKRTIAQGQNRS